MPVSASSKLPLSFWRNWYDCSQKHASSLFESYWALEKLLLSCDDEVLSKPLAALLYRCTRFWHHRLLKEFQQVSVMPKSRQHRLSQQQSSMLSTRISAGKHPEGLLADSSQEFSKEQAIEQQQDFEALQASKSLAPGEQFLILLTTWDTFAIEFSGRFGEMQQYQKALLKAFAIPMSFCGLELLQLLGQAPIPSIIPAQQRGGMAAWLERGTPQERLWRRSLLQVKFLKNIGRLEEAEGLLENLLQQTKKLNTKELYSEALFELCDTYRQLEKGEELEQALRQVLLYPPRIWGFPSYESDIWQELQEHLPQEFPQNLEAHTRILWAGLYAIASEALGPGQQIPQQKQKLYWAQIIQLKKAISEQYSSFTAADDRNFYSLQRAKLLLYYVLILEHLSASGYNSAKSQEENSLLWKNVMTEIYSLSKDISLRCKQRFS